MNQLTAPEQTELSRINSEIEYTIDNLDDSDDASVEVAFEKLKELVSERRALVESSQGGTDGR